MREAHAIRCPKCSGTVDIDVAAQGAPAMPRTELHGDAKISRELRIHPSEVPKARRDWGDEGGHCWQPDGKLKFNHMSDADKFFKKLGKIRARKAEQAAEKAANKIS